MNEIKQGRVLPTSISDYLLQLRQALHGADPAMIQDALYDAEEYLRAELNANRESGAGMSEAEVIATVAGSYGAPEEVADIYRETEDTVDRALRQPRPRRRTSWVARFFGVAADAHSYSSLFYLLLTLLTGTFYFVCVVIGLSLSLGLSITILGLPLLVVFFALIRLLSLVEGRIIEALLGVRMPRRPLNAVAGNESGLLARIGAMFSDPRSWSTQLYFVLMLPLGVVYFSVFVTLPLLSLGLVYAPLSLLTPWPVHLYVLGHDYIDDAVWLTVPLAVCGVLLAFASLHLARALGRLHAIFAKHLLVRAEESNQ